MTERGPLPPKLYFRIGEVAGLVGVEPHVLRYWEREFRSIRPSKSAKGQRVYSRRDVENLLRVRELLYGQGFTIAGARKRLKDKDVATMPDEGAAPLAATETLKREAHPPRPAAAALDGAREDGGGLPQSVRRELESLRAEVEALLTELG
jgi:DNA-binding transcriptional MerR regulator